MKLISDKDFQLLATVSEHIRPEFDERELIWKDSPFAWVRKLSSGSRGKLGKRLVAAWCAAKGLHIDSTHTSEADLSLNGHPVEVKFSTLWESGIYRFQQLRDQDYEYVICLGVSPFQAHCWVIGKKLLMEHILGHKPQHRGAHGTDTFWFAVRPESPPSWLASCGGSLDQAFEVLKHLSIRR